MKVININTHPTVLDDSGSIRDDVTDLGQILATIDQACGRNNAIRAYIYALRDLQRAIDVSSFENNDAAIARAQAAVNKAFDRLIVAEFTLNRIDDHPWLMDVVS